MTKSTDSAPVEVTLLPCPFCGATDGWLIQAFTRATETFAYWSVECLDRGCEIADDESQELADAAWNCRAQSEAPLRAEVERLRPAIVALVEFLGEVRGVALGLAMSTDHPAPDEALMALYDAASGQVDIARAALNPKDTDNGGGR